VLRVVALLGIAVTIMLSARPAPAQQPNPFGSGRADSGGKAPPAPAAEIDERVKALDSVVYSLAPASRLTVKTGKAGLFGFAGHTHVIQARAFDGQVVYYPKTPSRSHLEITVVTDSLEVLTPPDTAEIRKVTEAMRTDILRTAEYHQIRLVSRQVTPSKEGFHIVGELTLVGQTHDVPIDVGVRIGLDTLQATSAFSIKQPDFGIKPFSGGPGGTVKVAHRVSFDIQVIAVRSGQEAARASP
jgi:polyisoprenoid-binding protein YceI